MANIQSSNRAIDGLRALAVFAVMMFHCGAPLSEGGWLGVDLFFVISGFLITTLLLDESQEFGKVSLKFFWARRFLRLMPIYVFYVSAISLAVLGGVGSFPGKNDWTPGMYVLSMWTYLHNFAPLGGIWSLQELTGHLWSLSVEEQFYFVWPLVLSGIAGWKHLQTFMTVVVAVVLAANFWGYSGSPPALQLSGRGVGLFVGCLAAILQVQSRGRLVKWGVLSSSAAWVAAAGVIASFVVITADQHAHGVDESSALRGQVPFFVFAVALLLMNLWHDSRSLVATVLSVRPLPEIGAISYGIYLYHVAVRIFTWDVLLPGIEHYNRFLKFGLRFVVFVALTLLLAKLSYRFIEQPFLRQKKRFRPNRTQELPLKSPDLISS